MIKTIFQIIIITFSAQIFANNSEILIDNQQKEMANKFVQYANDYDGKGISTLFDLYEFGTRVAQNSGHAAQQDNFAKGFFSTARENFGDNILLEMKRAYGKAKYVYDIEYGGVTGPVIRLDLGDNGVNYLILEMQKNKVGNYKIVDLFVATQDALFSQVLGDISQIFVKPNASVLSRVFGKIGSQKEILETFKKVVRLNREGDYLSAYKAITSLPPKVRNQKLVILMAANFAWSVNENLYKHELSLLAEHYAEDPSVAFHLIDYYFYQQDFAKAIELIENFENKLKPDGHTFLLKSSAALSGADFDKGLEFAQACIGLEFYKMDCHLAKIDNLLGLKQYSQVVDSLKIIQDEFHWEFSEDNFTSVPAYKDFIKSNAFKDWMASGL